MRRYDIISGILLILSIIDFALAAPVLVQEKRRAGIDVVLIPKDVITVLEKRMDEGDLWKLVENFKAWGKHIDSSDAHGSSSSVPPGPDHGSTGVVHAPAQNPESSTANPMMEPSSPSSTTPVPDSFGDPYNAAADDIHSNAGSDGSLRSMFTPSPSEYDSDHEWESKVYAPDGDQPHANFDWYRMSLEDTQPQRPESLTKEIGLGIPSSGDASTSRLTSTLDSPPLYPDPQSLIAGPQPVDPAYLEAATLYAKKGKAKQLRRVSGTARDVGKCGPEGVSTC